MGFLAPAVAPMVAKNNCSLISYVPVFVCGSGDLTLDTANLLHPDEQEMAQRMEMEWKKWHVDHILEVRIDKVGRHTNTGTYEPAGHGDHAACEARRQVCLRCWCLPLGQTRLAPRGGWRSKDTGGSPPRM